MGSFVVTFKAVSLTSYRRLFRIGLKNYINKILYNILKITSLFGGLGVSNEAHPRVHLPTTYMSTSYLGRLPLLVGERQFLENH
ncbi:hypothetical protein G9A89_003972 [Geosiphon pyriformis]|nr:hypothetical protein G9A89_003972 [Geosiphon pyriformis]